MKYLLTSILMLCFLLNGTAQTKSTRNVQAAFENEQALFFYQSTLRALNTNENEELDKLIRGVDKITVVIVDKSESENLSASYNTFVKDITNEGYSEMMAISSPELKFGWYAQNVDEAESFAAVMQSEDSFTVLDFQGELDLNLLSSLEYADMQKFMELLDIKKEK